MKISVIIPAFNEERLLDGTLARVKSAMETFTQRRWESELIVCDNNSTDRTAEIARAAGATVVFEPINQIARARNSGAAAATGDWLIFVDADSQPSAELFADVAEQIQSGRCLAGGSTVRMDEEKHLLAEFFTWVWNCSSRMGRWLAGSFIFVEGAAFRKLGGFNNELFAAEELDLSKRLKHSRGNGQGNRDIASAPAGDFGAQDAALHGVGPSQIAGARHIQPSRAQSPRVLHSLVRRAAMT